MEGSLRRKLLKPENPLHIKFEVPGANRVGFLGKAGLCGCLLDV